MEGLEASRTLAILSVLLLHSIPVAYLVKTYSTLYIWQAVPVFMIVLGITLHLSFSKRANAKPRDLYTKGYFAHRLTRFVHHFFLSPLSTCSLPYT